jgi:hypothetical protein
VVAILGTSYGMIKANRALRENVDTVENAELLKEERFKPLLKDLLAGAVAHYDRFIDQHEHEQNQLIELASALDRVARISTLSGDVEKAIESRCPIRMEPLSLHRDCPMEINAPTLPRLRDLCGNARKASLHLGFSGSATCRGASGLRR